MNESLISKTIGNLKGRALLIGLVMALGSGCGGEPSGMAYVTSTPTLTTTPRLTATYTPHLMATPTPSPTRPLPQPTATPSPWPTGDLWWTRQVHVYDAVSSPPAPIAGAQVQASAISSDSCTTDSNGYCSVTVHAHDTGWVHVSVTASGYQPFNNSYPGLPSYGELNIGLQPLSSPTSTSTPTATHTPTPSPTRPYPQPTATPIVLPRMPMPLPVAVISPHNADQVTQLNRWGWPSWVNQAAWSPDGRLVAVASSIGIFLYDARTLKEVHSIFVEPFWTRIWVSSVAFSPDGKVLASEWLGEARLWSVPDGRLIRTLDVPQPACVAFSPDGKLLALGSGDDIIRLWSIVNGSLLHTLTGHKDVVTSVAFSPDGAILASGSWDDTVRLWSVPDGQPLHTLEGHTEDVESVAFGPKGEMVASGGEDGTARLWSVSDGLLLRTLKEPKFGVPCVAFSPDGKLLASGSVRTVRLWSVSDGLLLHTLKDHEDIVTSVAFSPDGTMLVSGSRILRLWGIKGTD